MTIQAASGVVSWTPSLAQIGTKPVLIRITDGLGGHATQTFAIGVGTAALKLASRELARAPAGVFNLAFPPCSR